MVKYRAPLAGLRAAPANYPKKRERSERRISLDCVLLTLVRPRAGIERIPEGKEAAALNPGIEVSLLPSRE